MNPLHLDLFLRALFGFFTLLFAPQLVSAAVGQVVAVGLLAALGVALWVVMAAAGCCAGGVVGILVFAILLPLLRGDDR